MSRVENPLIAVNGILDTSREPAVRLANRYAQSVLKAGGVPLVIPPVGGPQDVERLLDSVDGLLLTGGDDFQMEPLGLGATHPAADPTPLEKQEFDLLLARAAIERGLRFLAAQQANQGDGSIPSLGSNPARLAVTSLGALAYMAAGSTPDRGPHGNELARAIDHLLSHADLDTTSQQLGYLHDPADRNSKMHAHGFAALALAELLAERSAADNF